MKWKRFRMTNNNLYFEHMFIIRGLSHIESIELLEDQNCKWGGLVAGQRGLGLSRSLGLELPCT